MKRRRSDGGEVGVVDHEPSADGAVPLRLMPLLDTLKSKFFFLGNMDCYKQEKKWKHRPQHGKDENNGSTSLDDDMWPFLRYRLDTHRFPKDSYDSNGRIFTKAFSRIFSCFLPNKLR